jgi:hypothetical protein
MTLASMTGFARSEGTGASPTAWTWAWELRSVNGQVEYLLRQAVLKRRGSGEAPPNSPARALSRRTK